MRALGSHVPQVVHKLQVLLDVIAALVQLLERAGVVPKLVLSDGMRLAPMRVVLLFNAVVKDLRLGSLAHPLLEQTVALVLKREGDRKSTRLNSSHITLSRMPSSA